MAKSTLKQILEAASQTDADLDGALSEGMMEIADRIQHERELAAFLRNPSVKDVEKKKALDVAFPDVRAESRNTALILIRNGFFSKLDEAAVHIHADLLERAGQRAVRVDAAVALDNEQEDAIRKAVKPLLGREPVLNVRVDPELIGGIRIFFEDQEFDGTIAGRLNRLRDRIATLE